MLNKDRTIFTLSFLLLLVIFVGLSNLMILFPLFFFMLYLIKDKRFLIILILLSSYFFAYNYIQNKSTETLDNKKVILKRLVLCEKQGNNYIMKSELGKLLVKTDKDFSPSFGKIYKHVPCTIYREEDTSNFFSFDYSKYLKSKKVFYTTYISKPKNISTSFSLKKIIFDYLSEFIDIDKVSEVKLFALSMTFGVKSAKKKIYNIFSEYGLNHLIAFSGTHLSIFLMLFSYYKRQNIITLSLPLFFLFFCFSPSLLRAAFIFYMNYFSLRYDRKPYVLEWLGLFSIFYILINPNIIWDPSFILSYFFFSQIILFNKSKTCLVFLLSIENLFLNGHLFLLFPFISSTIIFLMPILISSGLLWTFTFFKYDFLLFFYDLLYKTLKCDQLQKIYFVSPFSFFSFIILFIFTSIFRKKIFYYFFSIYIIVFLYFNFFPYMLIFDTGHGQSIFVNSPGSSFLIDAGNTDYNIDKTVSSFLEYFSKNIDYTIISHDDWDHYSGSISLYQKGYLKNIYAGNNSSLQKKNIPVKKIRSFNYRCFPNFNISGKRLKEIGSDNERSLFFSIKFLKRKILILSDLESELLDLRLSNDPSVSIVVVGHHGSKSSLSEKTLSLWDDPTFFISCNRKFNNPNPAILRLLKNKKFFSTRTKGAIFIDLTTGFKLFSGK